MDYLFLFGEDFSYLLPEIFLSLGIFTLVVHGVLNSTSVRLHFPVLASNLCWLCIITLVFVAFLICNQDLEVISSGLFYGLLEINGWTQLSKLIIVLSSAVVFFMSIGYVQKEKLNDFELGIFILLSVLGMLFIISSHDLMCFYMSLELQSLSLYVLACFKRNSLLSVEAGLKYFVLGAFSSGLLLFGISIIYGLTGTTNLEDLTKLLLSEELARKEDFISLANGMKIGLLFVMVSLLFKIYAVPFHQWVPDVYQGSPTAMTAFFAVTPSLSIVAFLVRILETTFLEFLQNWQFLLLISSILSILVGSLGAIYQVSMKRFLAYSAIGHVGYLLVGLCGGSKEGAESILFYMVIYILMNIAFFSLVMSLRPLRSSSDQESDPNQEGELSQLKDLGGLSRLQPFSAMVLAILLFSMAGIPPLAGFFSKLLIFLSAVHQDLVLLVLVGILGSVLSAVYYLKVVRYMYFQKPSQWYTFEEMEKERSFWVSLSFVVICFFFLYPNPLFLLIHKMTLTF